MNACGVEVLRFSGSQDLEDIHQLFSALDLLRIQPADIESIVRQAGHIAADENFSGSGQTVHVRCHVNTVSDNGILHFDLGANITCHHHAGCDPDSH